MNGSIVFIFLAIVSIDIKRKRPICKLQAVQSWVVREITLIFNFLFLSPTIMINWNCFPCIILVLVSNGIEWSPC